LVKLLSRLRQASARQARFEVSVGAKAEQDFAGVVHVHVVVHHYDVLGEHQ
jgi:hypothetical protein